MTLLLKGWNGDLERSGIKKGQFESPGMYNHVPGDSIRDLLIPQLEVTIRPSKGHVFTIPKRSPAELPGNHVLITLLILLLALIYIHWPSAFAARESPRVSEP